jgi:ribosome-binding protein aMBF1 (putative translation factor)
VTIKKVKRYEYRLSPCELVGKLGIQPSLLKQWEEGDAMPSQNERRTLSTALGLANDAFEQMYPT